MSRSKRRQNQVWRIVGRDKLTKAPRPVGFLVTNAARGPLPIAFVRGVGRSSLFKSFAIACNPNRARKATSDLRKWQALRDVPSWLLGMLLVPVDRRGRIIDDRTFCEGQYMPAARPSNRPVQWHRYTCGSLKWLENQQPKKERDALNVPSDAKLGSNIEEAGKSVAA